MTTHSKPHPHADPHHPHWPLAGLLFVFVLLLAAFSVHETGTWINIRTGAEILANRALPSADSFSYTVSGRPWSTDSWLSDILFQHLDRSGPWALKALKCIVIAAGFALLLPINPSSPLIAAGVLALAAAAAWPGMTEIPAFFDFLLLALLIRVLRPKRAFTWATVAQVGIIELLWANLNGSAAVLGFWLVGLKVAKTSVHAGRDDRLRFAALLAAAAIGLTLNPHGIAVTGHMFFGAPSVNGWQPLSAWFNLYVAFAALGAMACWTCLQSEFFLAMTAASLLALSVVVPSLRPLYVLAAAPVLALALGHYVSAWRQTPGRVARLAAAMALLCGLHWYVVYAPLGRLRGYGVSGLEGAVNFIKDNALSGRMFNEPETGDELVALSGRTVFVDGRAGLYGPRFMKDAERWPARFRHLAEAYRFDYALILNRRAAYPARALDENPDWRLVYADDAALVYVRRSGTAGWLVSNLSRRRLSPNRLWPEELDAPLARPAQRGRVVEELDRWIVQSPGSVEALLWKAYALDRLNLPQKAGHLLTLARERLRLRPDAELMAVLGFVLERRGQSSEARRAYLRSGLLARRAGERALDAEVSLRLAANLRQSGNADQAARLEERARGLAARAEE
ncbi:MAG TPA: hypothetical protein DEB40_10420 [Elusimicrobia bacterium]|nr:hypothetical protein [Elusimicrobiota bacterium]HBT62144.1 hypothetical protein [Elusimicrobiota bacterium]